MQVDYDHLIHHKFVSRVLFLATELGKDVYENNGFKLEAKEKRLPTLDEFYCFQLGWCLSHVMTAVQQLEHAVFYMSNFKMTEAMEKAGINRSSHLLWSIENYIVRTQTVYDRLLILIDRLFNLQNQTNRIDHESIVTNAHISRTKVPAALKRVKNTVKKYYHDRNTIMHESSYAEEELRRFEGLSIYIAACKGIEASVEYVEEDLKYEMKAYIGRRKRDFKKLNGSLIKAISELFDEMLPLFEKKYSELKKQ